MVVLSNAKYISEIKTFKGYTFELMGEEISNKVMGVIGLDYFVEGKVEIQIQIRIVDEQRDK